MTCTFLKAKKATKDNRGPEELKKEDIDASVVPIDVEKALLAESTK